MHAIKNFIQLSFLVLACCCPVCGSSDDSVDTKPDSFQASAQEAEQWLALVDQRKYAQSWLSASVTLKMLVPKQRWVDLMENIREPLGHVRSRKILEQRPAKDPKNLPKGDYMIFVYDTSFSRKDKAHELLTLIQQSDGRWKVLTYLVQ